MTPDAYKAYLHEFRCVVCDTLEDKITMPVQIHHTESVRDKWSHFAACPMCSWHHQELHRLSRRGFLRAYGLDEVGLLKHTIRLLMEKT